MDKFKGYSINIENEEPYQLEFIKWKNRVFFKVYKEGKSLCDVEFGDGDLEELRDMTNCVLKSLRAELNKM